MHTHIPKHTHTHTYDIYTHSNSVVKNCTYISCTWHTCSYLLEINTDHLSYTAINLNFYVLIFTTMSILLNLEYKNITSKLDIVYCKLHAADYNKV